jgi:hypothetical protein
MAKTPPEKLAAALKANLKRRKAGRPVSPPPKDPETQGEKRPKGERIPPQKLGVP